MRRIVIVPLVVIAGFLAAACEETDTAAPEPVDAFAAVTVAPTAAIAAIVPADQVTSCVDSTKYGAFVGEAEASARWNSAGQSDVALVEACTQIGRDDPDVLATMHWNWTAAQAAAASTVPPAPVAAPANNCEPSYPDICLPADGPDINCPDISERRFRVLEPDPYELDGNDHDGIGCESD